MAEFAAPQQLFTMPKRKRTYVAAIRKPADSDRWTRKTKCAFDILLIPRDPRAPKALTINLRRSGTSPGPGVRGRGSSFWEAGERIGRRRGFGGEMEVRRRDVRPNIQRSDATRRNAFRSEDVTITPSRAFSPVTRRGRILGGEGDEAQLLVSRQSMIKSRAANRIILIAGVILILGGMTVLIIESRTLAPGCGMLGWGIVMGIGFWCVVGALINLTSQRG